MSLPAIEQTAPRRSAALRLQIGLAFLAFVLIGANDGAFGVLLPSLQTAYGLDKASVSYLFLAGTAGYLIAALSSGGLVEWLGERRFLMLGTAILALAWLTLSQVPPLVVTVLMLLSIGCGLGILDAGLNAYVAGLPQSTALLNYLHAFYGGGALLGPLIAGALLNTGQPWSAVYWLWAGLATMVLLGVRLSFPARPARSADEPDSPRLLRQALRLPVVWLASCFLLFYVGAEVSLGNWSYSYLTEERAQPTLLSSWIVSGFWMGLTVGRVALAQVAERIGSARLIQGCLAGVVLGVLLVWFSPFVALTAFGLWLAGFSLGPIFPSVIALMSTRVVARLLPTAIGFLASFGSMGAALFPWLAGNLAERAGLTTLLPYVAVLTMIMLGLWIALQRTRSDAPPA